MCKLGQLSRDTIDTPFEEPRCPLRKSSPPVWFGTMAANRLGLSGHINSICKLGQNGIKVKGKILKSSPT